MAPKTNNRRSSRLAPRQRGAAFVQMLSLVGLFGFVAGGVMLHNGEQLLDTAKSGDESMNASTLGNGSSVHSGSLYEGSDGISGSPSDSSGSISDSSGTIAESGTIAGSDVDLDDGPTDIAVVTPCFDEDGEPVSCSDEGSIADSDGVFGDEGRIPGAGTIAAITPGELDLPGSPLDTAGGIPDAPTPDGPVTGDVPPASGSFEETLAELSRLSRFEGVATPGLGDSGTLPDSGSRMPSTVVFRGPDGRDVHIVPAPIHGYDCEAGAAGRPEGWFTCRGAHDPSFTQGRVNIEYDESYLAAYRASMTVADRIAADGVTDIGGREITTNRQREIIGYALGDDYFTGDWGAAEYLRGALNMANSGIAYVAVNAWVITGDDYDWAGHWEHKTDPETIKQFAYDATVGAVVGLYEAGRTCLNEGLSANCGEQTGAVVAGVLVARGAGLTRTRPGTPRTPGSDTPTPAVVGTTVVSRPPLGTPSGNRYPIYHPETGRVVGHIDGNTPIYRIEPRDVDTPITPHASEYFEPARVHTAVSMDHDRALFVADSRQALADLERLRVEQGYFRDNDLVLRSTTYDEVMAAYPNARILVDAKLEMRGTEGARVIAVRSDDATGTPIRYHEVEPDQIGAHVERMPDRHAVRYDALDPDLQRHIDRDMPNNSSIGIPDDMLEGGSRPALERYLASKNEPWSLGRNADGDTILIRGTPDDLGADVRIVYTTPPPPQRIPANEIRFSQRNISDPSDKTLRMTEAGFNTEGTIDVVRMNDGGLTTVDNRRVFAASQAGVEVDAVVHRASDPLSMADRERFTVNGKVPETWGEAIDMRIRKQGAVYRDRFPNGSPYTGISTPQPSIPQPNGP